MSSLPPRRATVSAPPGAGASSWERDLRAASIRRILIIKWSALGDIAIASATMQDLRVAFPDAELELETRPPWDGLFAHDARFARVHRFEPDGRHRGLSGHWRWVRRVRRARYDLVVDLQCNDHTRLLLGLLTASGPGIAHRVGYFRRFPYNVAPAPDATRHHSHDYARAALRAGGIEARTERPV
ncbi:MAG: hypothetical protein R3357_16655, partial [Burkholderiales bacterium]|nr:hypothetical protein [Burkholderiales bacterium]